MIIGYTYLVADVLHYGHLLYLENASKLCDTLFVGILSDKAVMEKKPKPIMSLQERINIVKSLKFVTCVVCQDEYSPLNNCMAIRPDILIESSSHKEMSANNFMKSTGGKVVVMPYYTEQSSSQLKERIKNEDSKSVGNKPAV
jgi:cytidyltransferase-like protein